MSRFFGCGTLLSRVHLLAAIGVAVGCGMRGPPLPPLVIVPAAVTALEIQHVNDVVFIRFEVPLANADGSEPADLERVEVYALTTHPDPTRPVRQLPVADWRDHATLVATVPVVMPTRDAGPDSDLKPVQSDAVRPGDEVTLIELLTAEVSLPVVIESETVDEDETQVAKLGAVVTAAPLVVPPPPPPPRRTYLVIGISTRGRESLPSPRIAVALADTGSAPSAPTVTYTETELVLEWVAPATARFPIQEAVIDGAPVPYRSALVSEPVIRFPLATRYLVYASEVDTTIKDPADESETARPEPINIEPGTETSYVDVGVSFGVERCYTVRTFDVVDSLPVRGPASPSTCVIPVDTFAPQPPANVVAIASLDAISLVWDPSPEPDVGGYLVLRGTAPGETLQSLTAEPIVETTYRDIAVESDQEYVYAVQAVDAATPRNVSLPSVEVMEQAR